MSQSSSLSQRPRKKVSNTSEALTLTRPDEWALRMKLRVDGRDFTLHGREFVRQVIRDFSPVIVIPKAAQMAYTVSMITKSLHHIAVRRLNGLYLLPLKTGAIPFVQARIDPVIESNPTLRSQFSSVDNRLHKQSIHGHNLYIRGTNIERELQEVPVDFEIWDERDRMVDENLPDARHRMDGSDFRRLVIVSTPTVEGYGVYAEDAWDDSDQHRWEVPCPRCKRFQVLNWDDPGLNHTNLQMGENARDCVLECVFCHRPITDMQRRTLNAKGRWVPHNLNGNIRGYHINQFNSPTQPLHEIMADFYNGQRDARRLKAFFNQNMGRPYTAAGDKITIALLDKCIQSGYECWGRPASYVAVGIDIGMLIHVWCWHFDRYKRKMLWGIKIFRTWDELDKFLAGLVSWVGVIDAHPEKTKAHELVIKYHGKLRLGFSDDREQAHEMATFFPLKRGEAGRVNIDKSAALDSFIQDMLNGRVILPSNARELGELLPRKPFNGFYSQQLQMVRVEEENTRGTIVARWKKNRNPDHWHHAGMFATVAANQKPPLSVPPVFSTSINRSSVWNG